MSVNLNKPEAVSHACRKLSNSAHDNTVQFTVFCVELATKSGELDSL